MSISHSLSSAVNRVQPVIKPDIRHALQSPLQLNKGLLPRFVQRLTRGVMRHRIESEQSTKVKQSNYQRLPHVGSAGMVVPTIRLLDPSHQRINGLDVILPIAPNFITESPDGQIEDGQAQGDLNIKRLETVFRFINEPIFSRIALAAAIYRRNTNSEYERDYRPDRLNPSGPVAPELESIGKQSRNRSKQYGPQYEVAIAQPCGQQARSPRHHIFPLPLRMVRP